MDNSEQQILNARLEHLAREIKKGKVVLFIGSGLSLNADPKNNPPKEKFLVWNQLANLFKKDLGNNKELDSLSAPKLIQLYEDQFDRNSRNRIIRNAIPDNEYNPSELHKKILNIEEFPWHAIVTTNIDTLIERTLDEIYPNYSCVYKEEHFSNIEGLAVYKIHGDIKDSNTFTFSENEYLNFELEKAIFVSKLEQLFAEFTFLFIGYSLSDPDLLAIQSRIHYRLKGFNRSSYIFSKDEKPYWIEYWKKKSLILFNRDSLKNLKNIEAKDHYTFLLEVYALLKEKTKEVINAKAIQKVGENLWRRTELATILESKTEIKKFRDTLYNIDHDPNNLVNKSFRTLELKKKSNDIVNYLYNILKAINENSDLLLIKRESIEEIFYLNDLGHPYNDLYIDLIFILFEEKNLESIDQDKLKYCLAEILFCVYERIKLGMGTGFNNKSLFKKLIRIKKKTIFKNEYSYYYLQILSFLFISGFGFKEKYVGKILRILTNTIYFQNDLEMKNLMLYRIAISNIYNNQFQLVRFFVEKEIPNLKKWNSLWKAVLWYELGEMEKAISEYQIIQTENKSSLYEKYIAFQGSYYLEPTNFKNLDFYKKSDYKSSELKKKLFKLEELAYRENISLRDFNIYEDGIEKLIRNLHKISIEKENNKRKASSSITFSANSYSEFSQIYNYYEKLYSLGLPSFPFAYSELRITTTSIFSDSALLEALFEISLLLPIFKDFNDVKLPKMIYDFAWKHPLRFRFLQRNILNAYKNIIEYNISYAKKNDTGFPTRMEDRLKKIIEITAVSIHWFDKPTKKEFLEYTKQIISKLNSDVLEEQAFNHIFISLMANSSNRDKIRLFQSFAPEFWLGWESRYLYENIKELLPKNTWYYLSNSYKKKLQKYRNILDESALLRFIDFASNIENKEDNEYTVLLNFIEKKVAEYRHKLIEQFNKIISERKDLDPQYTQIELKKLAELNEEKDSVSIEFFHLKNSQKKNIYSFEEIIKSIEEKGILNANGLLIHLFDLNLTLEEIERMNSVLEKELNKLVQNYPREIISQNSFFPNNYLEYISAYYLRFQQFKEWFNLLFKYGCQRISMHSKEDCLKMREIYEKNESLSTPLQFQLILSTRKVNHSYDGLYYIIKVFYQNASTITKEDIIFLNYLWYSDSLQIATDLILEISNILAKLDKDNSGNQVENYLSRLQIVFEDLKVFPSTQRKFIHFFEFVNQHNKDLYNKYSVIEKIQEKFKILDFPKQEDFE